LVKFSDFILESGYIKKEEFDINLDYKEAENRVQ
jgi:hypothetical protein